jgi:hypothetical protein
VTPFNAARDIVARLCSLTEVRVTETPSVFRVQNINGADNALLESLITLDESLEAADLGGVQLHGTISEALNIRTVREADVSGEGLAVVIQKTVEDAWCYFLTPLGFEHSLRKGLISKLCQCIWVLEEFEPFATYAFSVKGVGTDKNHESEPSGPERPLKLVRDFSQKLTPERIEAWLLKRRPTDGSAIFTLWQNAAKEKLAFCLPTEIRSDADECHVVFKGGRSYPIKVEAMPPWPAIDFDKFHDACEWVYGTAKESETKFQLLNNHISMSWIDTEEWPSGASRSLANSLAGAREAYAFHLQDQSKEALKSLGELRKGLQEEVNKVQSSTKDLASSIWRDFALAGIVLALKTPMLSAIASESALKILSVGTALLLLFSLCITIYSNKKFNRIADQARGSWRSKLYAFMSDSDWNDLVERPIEHGRAVYYVSLAVSSLLYIAMIAYLVWIGAPELVEAHVVEPWHHITAFLSSIKCA